ncbi:unnamed protein product [Nesidiocoris tenuis]|uniref:Uncharacterized protein n=1 Tax=Nesidiocoris tenuis TaxID=355587 RepID=A0A6H5G8J7_9HEMI|nr:unnamed protein product [Nesidiocoris tenuis]
MDLLNFPGDSLNNIRISCLDWYWLGIPKRRHWADFSEPTFTTQRSCVLSRFYSMPLSGTRCCSARYGKPGNRQESSFLWNKTDAAAELWWTKEASPYCSSGMWTDSWQAHLFTLTLPHGHLSMITHPSRASSYYLVPQPTDASCCPSTARIYRRPILLAMHSMDT